MTLHRPSNVDDKDNLLSIIKTVMDLAGDHKIIFPVHPRTRKNFDQTGFSDPRLILTEPMGYLEFIYTVKTAKGVITDSGGITEEATVLGIPCMTMRNSTERPETCVVGTNELIGTDPKALAPAMEKLMSGQWKSGGIPDMWDGNAAERIIQAILVIFKQELVYD
jgi:UDP-N-acetylglucosamine 2-epimerase (non-hydrolysing)